MGGSKWWAVPSPPSASRTTLAARPVKEEWPWQSTPSQSCLTRCGRKAPSINYRIQLERNKTVCRSVDRIQIFESSKNRSVEIRFELNYSRDVVWSTVSDDLSRCELRYGTVHCLSHTGICAFLFPFKCPAPEWFSVQQQPGIHRIPTATENSLGHFPALKCGWAVSPHYKFLIYFVQ